MSKAVAPLLALALASTASAAIWSEGFENGLEGWVTTAGEDIELNNEVWTPGGACEGANYASLSTGLMETQEAHFTSITVAPSSTVTLAGVVAYGILNPQSPRDFYIQLVDGSSASDTVVAEWRVTASVTIGTTWTAFGPLSGHIATGHVKIRFGHTSGLWASGTAIHLDALTLTPEPTSVALFGLIGLPLLRRRQRT